MKINSDASAYVHMLVCSYIYGPYITHNSYDGVAGFGPGQPVVVAAAADIIPGCPICCCCCCCCSLLLHRHIVSWVFAITAATTAIITGRGWCNNNINTGNGNGQGGVGGGAVGGTG